MRQTSTSPIAEHGPYTPDSYLLPSPGVSSTPSKKHFVHHGNQYLTPMSPTSDEVNNNLNGVRPKLIGQHKEKHAEYLSMNNGRRPENSPGKRRRRLRSMSCEDLSDYLRHVVYDPISKSMSDLLNEDEEGENDNSAEPFPRLDMYTSMDLGHRQESYYNIEGLRGKVYDGPMLSVAELRKRFSTKSHARIRRSMSNPNFMKILTKEKLHTARVSAGIAAQKHGSRGSLVNLLPESIKKHLSKDGHHKGSNTTLSSGAALQHSHESSQASSAHTSPSSSLSRKQKSGTKDDIVASAGIKGINITKRTRSFKRQKHTGDEPSKDKADNDEKIEIADPNHKQRKIIDMTDKYELEQGKDGSNEPSTGQVNGNGVDAVKQGPLKVARKPGLKVGADSEEAVTSV